MRLAVAAIALFAPYILAASPALAAQISTRGSANVEAPTGVSVVQDVLAQTNLTVTIAGKPGDSLSLGVPGSVNVVNAAGQSLQVSTTSTALAYANGGIILSEDTVSVSIGGVADAQTAAAGNYGGVMRVVAQYN